MTDYLWLWPPLLAGLLVSVSLIPLGHQVLQRGVVFMDLAIAQWAVLGALLAQTLWLELPSRWGSLLAALVGALTVASLVRRLPAYREALIGILYVLAAALAVLAVHQDPHGAQRLAQALTGDVLWVSAHDLWPLLAALLIAAAVWWLIPAVLRPWLFYPLFAVVVTLSLELVGLYLVFLLLILPALVVMHLSSGGHGLAVLFAVFGFSGGVAASVWADWPTGPTIVVVMILLALVWRVLAGAVGAVSEPRRPS
ncbi:MAG: metal ABC transporter permease [Marinobacter sp.]|nr:metal ABC transporter permease [Marinobacter sp.]